MINNQYETFLKSIESKIHDISCNMTPEQDANPQTALLFEITKLLFGIMKISTQSQVKTFPEFHYSKKKIDSHAVPLKKVSFPLQQGVTVKADNDNSGTIYVGKEHVTPSGGFRLEPGEAVTIEIDDLAKVFAIGSVDSQNIHWMGV